jgi:hypothetical protein
VAGSRRGIRQKAIDVLDRALDAALAEDAASDALDRGMRAAELLVSNAHSVEAVHVPAGARSVRLHLQAGSDVEEPGVARLVAAVTSRFGVVEPECGFERDGSIDASAVRVVVDDLVIGTAASEERLEQLLVASLPELLTREETAELLDRARTHSPMVVQELVPNVLALGQLRQVLQKLLAERVPISRMSTILNALADSAVYTKDANALAEHVRIALGRTVYADLLDGDVLRAFMLSPDAERAIQNAIQLNESGQVLMLDPNTSHAIHENLVDALAAHRGQVEEVVVVTSPKIRRHVRGLLLRNFPRIVVLSYPEIAPGLQVEDLGTIEAHRPGRPLPEPPTSASPPVDAGDATDWNW